MASYADLHAAVQADPRSLPKIAALLKSIRTQKLRQSQVVATHGKTALQDPRRAARVLGDDVWAVYEQTLVAALDVDDAPLRDACQSALLKRFGGANPPSQRLERLEGLVAEAAGDWEGALKRYKGVLEQNPANSTALKREVCVVEAKGAGREAVIQALTKLTATCQSDRGAWQALAEAHAAAYRFSDAIFCYEELTLFDPTAQHYMRRLGELSRTVEVRWTSRWRVPVRPERCGCFWLRRNRKDRRRSLVVASTSAQSTICRASSSGLRRRCS